nr:MAG TPA: hypothetical protein [Bacteriophage sp.]
MATVMMSCIRSIRLSRLSYAIMILVGCEYIVLVITI